MTESVFCCHQDGVFLGRRVSRRVTRCLPNPFLTLRFDSKLLLQVFKIHVH